jgi:murein DD-endopeptidase MepM/ murein hydrolase activator NlpD
MFSHNRKMTVRYIKLLVILALTIFALGWLAPVNWRIPVADASPADWNPRSFWYSPWGRSGTHKGIDIFAKAGIPVLAATDGLIINTGFNDMGGNNVLILGAKWRFYYYAHLQQIDSRVLQWVSAGEKIGTVGNTGNAVGKPPHLHFAIRSLFPLIWQYDANKPQAWNKMFYLDPNAFLKSKTT